MRITIRAMLATASLAAALPVAAHPYSDRECREGSDFIKNAALARDNGYTRDFFLDRLRADLDTIKAYPRALRWFVKDARDEEFLLRHAERVYDAPRGSLIHQNEFYERCLIRSYADATT